jgi:hypothetical protein
VLFGLGEENEDGQVVWGRSGGQFVKGVTVDKAFARAVPPPRGEAVGVAAWAIAAINAKFFAVAELAPSSAGAGFEFGAVAGQIDGLG